MLPFDVHIHKAIYLPCSTTGGLLSYFGTIAFVMTLGEAVVLVDPVEHWLSDGEEQENSVLQYCDELQRYDEYEQSRLHGTNHGTSLT